MCINFFVVFLFFKKSFNDDCLFVTILRQQLVFSVDDDQTSKVKSFTFLVLVGKNY